MTQPTPDHLLELVRDAQAQARSEATRDDGTVDATRELVAFRRLINEAIAREIAEEGE